LLKLLGYSLPFPWDRQRWALRLVCSARFFFKRASMDDRPPMEFLAVFLFAYLAYVTAEVTYLSGIMAVFFCGITLAHYNWYNMSEDARHATHHGFTAIAQAAEMLVFVYLGLVTALSFTDTSDYTWCPVLIVMMLILCLVGRACHVFFFSNVSNLKRRQPITMRMLLLMWWAGLRGAIAFCLALNMPSDNQAVWVTVALAVVLFTTVVLGGATDWMVGILDLKRPAPLIEEHAPDEEHAELEELGDIDLGAGDVQVTPGGIHTTWRNIDRTYFKPLFGSPQEDRTRKANTPAYTLQE